MREAIRMGGLRGGQHDRALGAPSFDETVVHIVRRVQAERDVFVLGVVPAKEIHAVLTRVLEGAEVGGKVRPVFERFELRLRIRIVIRY